MSDTNTNTDSLKILVCTANVGNAEPTMSSMKCWITPECGKVVVGLDNNDGGASGCDSNSSEQQQQQGDAAANDNNTSFDIIVIGMQEATFKTNNKKKNSNNNKKDDDEEEELEDDDENDYYDSSDDDSEEEEEMALKVTQQLEEEEKGQGKEEGTESQFHLPEDHQTSNSNLSLVGEAVKGTAGKVVKGGQAVKDGGIKIVKDGTKVVAKVAKEGTKVVKDGGQVVAKQTKKAVSFMSMESLLGEPDSDYLRELMGDILNGEGTTAAAASQVQQEQDDDDDNKNSSSSYNMMYELIKEYQRGQMRLYVYVKRTLVDEISGLELKAENTGIGHVLANKGGIVCTFTIRRTRMTFLTAHLAAHEGDAYYKARNASLREILQGAKVGPKHLSGLDAASMSHHMWIMGDLNYRTRLPVVGGEDMDHEEQVKRVIEIIDNKDWEKLYSYDELSAGIKNKEMLAQFETLPCHFSPTFKMLREEGFKYKAQRVPSYTDRILYTSAAGHSANLTPLAYGPCPGFITSDHKPMRGAYAIATNAGSSDADRPLDGGGLTKLVSIVFKDLRCTDLPPADMDGLADPYITFIWDPCLLVRDDRAAKATNNTKPGFDGGKWPATAYRKKNLNPTWPEEVRLCIPATKSTDMEGAMMYMTVWDYDMNTPDDLMGSIGLNLNDLATLHASQAERQIAIDQPLLKYGTEQGRIQCTIVVRRGNIILNAGKREGRERGLLASFGERLSSLRLGSKK